MSRDALAASTEYIGGKGMDQDADASNIEVSWDPWVNEGQC